MNSPMNSPMREPSQQNAVAEVIAARRRAIALRRSIFALAVKLIAFLLAACLMLTCFFGVGVMSGEEMYPRLRDGDLLIYFRLEKSYETGEIVAFVMEGDSRCRFARIAARGGDTVDVTEDGRLMVNGGVQQEEIFFPTLKREDGIELPLTLAENEVFLLGDNRTAAVDSRAYGAVPLDAMVGKVITLLRRRGL